ncbi:hypothetical protein LSS_12814 [Leptospira santarosai serovar Shermani str. LT 821]|uniref:Uncharacterized protein n=1 Tax=Leptospira santarosai serovar Shermani str. LT 821 TaxID=758847 RepID=K8XY02_9LEPT|nr:hypothetical protein LSS_12814 [Leptospira santarosai serovar Shermani str. LT 821]
MEKISYPNSRKETTERSNNVLEFYRRSIQKTEFLQSVSTGIDLLHSSFLN